MIFYRRAGYNCIEPNAVETLVNLKSFAICFFHSFFLRLPFTQLFEILYHRRSADKISRCSKKWTRCNGRELMWSGISGGLLLKQRCPRCCCRIRNDSLSCARMMSRGHVISLIARFMGPTWGPPGTDRTQVGPMLPQWTLLSGLCQEFLITLTCFSGSILSNCVSHFKVIQTYKYPMHHFLTHPTLVPYICVSELVRHRFR